jgi:hypothetical protein
MGGKYINIAGIKELMFLEKVFRLKATAITPSEYKVLSIPASF